MHQTWSPNSERTRKSLNFVFCPLGVSQRPLTLILLQKYSDIKGSRIVIQIGGVYILLSAVLKHRVLERKRRPNANASVLGTQRFRTLSLRTPTEFGLDLGPMFI